MMITKNRDYSKYRVDELIQKLPHSLEYRDDDDSIVNLSLVISEEDPMEVYYYRTTDGSRVVEWHGGSLKRRLINMLHWLDFHIFRIQKQVF